MCAGDKDFFFGFFFVVGLDSGYFSTSSEAVIVKLHFALTCYI